MTVACVLQLHTEISQHICYLHTSMGDTFLLFISQWYCDLDLFSKVRIDKSHGDSWHVAYMRAKFELSM